MSGHAYLLLFHPISLRIFLPASLQLRVLGVLGGLGVPEELEAWLAQRVRARLLPAPV
jgi:hypothetical protein